MTEQQKKLKKPFISDILLQYRFVIPKVVCENCQKKDELVPSEDSDTGWYCRGCEGGEVNYLRDDFVEDVMGLEQDIKEQLEEVEQQATEREQAKFMSKINMIILGIKTWEESEKDRDEEEKNGLIRRDGGRTMRAFSLINGINRELEALSSQKKS